MPLIFTFVCMETVHNKYQGQLRTEAMHLQSGNVIITDAPTDNMGKGEAFSPTDLLATSLGSCILTTMAIIGERNGLSLEGTEAKITKIMANNPRRVAEVKVEVNFVKNYTENERQLLENAAHTCPVARSLHPDLVQTINFNYQ